MTNPITVAVRAKGPFAIFSRANKIIGRYGLTASQMYRALQHFSHILSQFDCGATFPITAVTLKRRHNGIKDILDRNIEFAVHGYTHVDYSLRTAEAQLHHMQSARQIFTNAGIVATGFRSPYLSREVHLYEAIEATGYSYVSNQPMLWDVLDKTSLNGSAYASYERALVFYNPWREAERVSIPRLVGNLIEIPVSLPDDEILIDRLGGADGLVKETWLSILSKSHQYGELFTLQLHPERIGLCADDLSAVLAKARTLFPAVWCARLDEIARWWKARITATIDIVRNEERGYDCIVNGPSGITVLARAVDVDVPTLPWTGDYRIIQATRFSFHASVRPCIGLSPATPNALGDFLRQQGYIVEISQQREQYAFYIDQVHYDANQERPILAEIEGSGCQLVKLGRWPNGSHSALAITGDIDALTLWDYGLRLIGK